MFGMEHDERVIIKFLWNERTDVRDIADRLQTQFAEHTDQLRTIRFWIVEARLGRQDLHNAIRTGKPPLDDLDAKILATLDKSQFESTHSISDRLLIAHLTVLQHLYHSIGFKLFHLHCMPHLLTDDLC
jgi:hypothetical protein